MCENRTCWRTTMYRIIVVEDDKGIADGICECLGRWGMEATGKIKRYRRFAGWDYAKGASLFITVATEPRRALFGKVQ